MALYKNVKALRDAIEQYDINNTRQTPRHFRISLGISKQTLDNWRKFKPDFFDLMKLHEDKIMANLELLFTFGGKEFYNVIYTLRAYDKEQYIEQRPLTLEQEAMQQEPVQLVLDIKDLDKGEQQ